MLADETAAAVTNRPRSAAGPLLVFLLGCAATAVICAGAEALLNAWAANYATTEAVWPWTPWRDLPPIANILPRETPPVKTQFLNGWRGFLGGLGRLTALHVGVCLLVWLTHGLFGWPRYRAALARPAVIASVLARSVRVLIWLAPLCLAIHQLGAHVAHAFAEARYPLIEAGREYRVLALAAFVVGEAALINAVVRRLVVANVARNERKCDVCGYPWPANGGAACLQCAASLDIDVPPAYALRLGPQLARRAVGVWAPMVCVFLLTAPVWTPQLADLLTQEQRSILGPTMRYAALERTVATRRVPIQSGLVYTVHNRFGATTLRLDEFDGRRPRGPRHDELQFADPNSPSHQPWRNMRHGHRRRWGAQLTDRTPDAAWALLRAPFDRIDVMRAEDAPPPDEDAGWPPKVDAGGIPSKLPQTE